MPLPQQVINQLSREAPETPGWSSGILTFSAGLLVIVLVIYLGVTFIYEPYINSRASDLSGQISKLSQSISSGDEAQLVAFYSQVSNLKTLLADHVIFSQFLDWLGGHTEANVYFSQFSFSLGDQVALTGVARTEADVNQQLAIWNAAPEVAHATVSNVSAATQGTGWQFTAALIMDPASLKAAAPSASSSLSASTTTTP